MKEFNYTIYSEMVKRIFGEELERMQEYLYCINNVYDASDDKPWVLSPDQNIPDYYDMKLLYHAEQDIVRYLEEELSDDRAEEVETNIKGMYYMM
jgi:hypothetical protein